MANRHLSRSVVLQSLYEWDFGGCHDEKIDDITSRMSLEFAPGVSDTPFINSLTKGVLGKRSEIDKVIEKAAPEWPIEKISVVDRNILRIGLFELLFADRNEVPAKVAINEAIELAKTYGGENSGKFVNGVLGSVYKELGEPGKEATPRKKKIPDVPYEEMPIQNLGGAVVYSIKDGDIYLGFVHDIFGHWTLSKGKIPKDIDVNIGTIAKVKEEMGIDVEIIEELGKNEYIASDPELGKLRKQVNYFLAKAEYGPLKLAEKPGLDDAKWFKLDSILELNFYNDILPIVTKAINILSKSK